jgi:hypothetical protein
MRRHSVMLAALLGTLLLCIPLQSQAFFGFFGGGFSFGTGWGGWGGPGWWGPGWWGPRYWGAPGYGWHRPFYRHYYRHWGWPNYLRPYPWGYGMYGLPLPYLRLPDVAAPTATTPAEPVEK